MRKRRWSDDQLREAVAASRTFRATYERLELTSKWDQHRARRRLRELGLDTSHFETQSQVGRCAIDHDALRAAVPLAGSLAELVTRLGLESSEPNEKRLRRMIRTLALDTSHFRTARGRHRRRWSDDQLRAAVVASRSYAQVLRALGLVAAGGNYGHVQEHIVELGLDTSHFLPAWSGLRPRRDHARPLAEVLVVESRVGSHKLKRRLIREGLKEARCELCGWCARAPDGRVPVELDHINGDKLDNRLENLRVLCPNCHSLQPTHRGLNRRRRVM